MCGYFAKYVTCCYARGRSKLKDGENSSNHNNDCDADAKTSTHIATMVSREVVRPPKIDCGKPITNVHAYTGLIRKTIPHVTNAEIDAALRSQSLPSLRRNCVRHLTTKNVSLACPFFPADNRSSLSFSGLSTSDGYANRARKCKCITSPAKRQLGHPMEYSFAIGGGVSVHHIVVKPAACSSGKVTGQCIQRDDEPDIENTIMSPTRPVPCERGYLSNVAIMETEPETKPATYGALFSEPSARQQSSGACTSHTIRFANESTFSPGRVHQSLLGRFDSSLPTSQPGKRALAPYTNLQTVVEGSPPVHEATCAPPPSVELACKCPKTPLMNPFIDPHSFSYIYQDGKPVFVGGGACGLVFLGRYATPCGHVKDVCIKNSYDTDYKRTLKEYVCYEMLRSLDIVPWAYGIIDHCDENASERYGLVMDFLGFRKDLYTFLRASSMRFPAETWINVAVQLAESVQTAHDTGICLNDLTSKNVMVDVVADTQLKIYLIDFSHATLSTTSTRSSADVVVIRGIRDESQDSQLSRKRDVHSLGNIIFDIYKHADNSMERECLDGLRVIGLAAMWPALSEQPAFTVTNVIGRLRELLDHG